MAVTRVKSTAIKIVSDVDFNAHKGVNAADASASSHFVTFGQLSDFIGTTTEFIRNQNAAAQVASAWINGTLRADGGVQFANGMVLDGQAQLIGLTGTGNRIVQTGATGILSAGIAVDTIAQRSGVLTSGRIPYTTTGGALKDSSALRFVESGTPGAIGLFMNGTINATIPPTNSLTSQPGVFSITPSSQERPYAVDMRFGNYVFHTRDSDYYIGGNSPNTSGVWFLGKQMHVVGIPTIIFGSRTGPEHTSRMHFGVNSTTEYQTGSAYPGAEDNYFHITTEKGQTTVYKRRGFRLSAYDIRFLSGEGAGSEAGRFKETGTFSLLKNVVQATGNNYLNYTNGYTAIGYGDGTVLSHKLNVNGTSLLNGAVTINGNIVQNTNAFAFGAVIIGSDGEEYLTLSYNGATRYLKLFTSP